MERSEQKGLKPTMIYCKLRSGVNWQWALKPTGVKQTGVVYTDVCCVMWARNFEKRVLSEIPRMQQATVGNCLIWSVGDLCSSLNIIGVIQSRRVEWVGKWRAWEQKCIQNFGGETLKKGTDWKTWARHEDNIKICVKNIVCWLDLSGSEQVLPK
jgi:hypothetical protein